MALRLLTGSSLGLAAAAALAAVLAPACGGGGETSASASSSSGSSSSGGDTTTAAGSGGASSSTGSSSTGSATSGTGGSTGSGMPSDVTGTSVTSYVTPDGVKPIPDDLSAVTVEALVPSSAGGFTKVAGSGTADGNFKIPAVPAGSFLLHVDKLYVDSSARDFDLGAERRGRPDRAAASTSPTDLVNELKNVDPYQEGDVFEWFVANTDSLLASNPAAWTANPPAPGVLALSDATIDWASPGAYLIDKDRGDALAVAQLATRTSAFAARYNTITRFLTFLNVTQGDGKATTINGTLADVPQKLSVNLDVKAASFEGFKAKVGPGATEPAGATVTLATAPAASTYGALDASATLVQLMLPVASAEANFGALKYGDPYPAEWGTFARVAASFEVSYLAPGASSPFQGRAEVGLTTDLATLGAGPVEPLVGPVEGLKVNGNDALGSLTAVTATPTLTWGAPTLGTPTHYEIEVLALENKNGKSHARAVAAFFTGATELTLPEGVLSSGSTYVVRVRAALTSAAALTKPRHASPKAAFADVLTSAMQP